MNFLSIPEEVIESSILPHLKWNDLLRFRRVCQLTKTFVHGYFKLNPELTPELEINEDDKNFRAFLEMNIPTTKIYLNNPSGREFYYKDRKNLKVFLEKDGPLIKSLRLLTYPVFIYGKELKFLEALPNLWELVADHYGFGEGVLYETQKEKDQLFVQSLIQAMGDPRFKENPYPDVPDALKKLQVVKIGQKDVHLGTAINWTREYLVMAGNLEHVAFPFNTNITRLSNWLPAEIRAPVHSLAVLFGFIYSAVKKRAELEDNLGAIPPTQLKTVDFVNCHGMEPEEAISVIWNASTEFLKLCNLCAENNVGLKNVSPLWYIQRLQFPEYSTAVIGIPIVSLMGLHSAIFPLDMPNLEKITVKTSKGSVGNRWRQERPDWPQLKCLDIFVDSRQTSHMEFDPASGRGGVNWVDSKNILNALFQDVVRPTVTELTLKFTTDPEIRVVIPKTEEIVGACPNLKKLVIGNWLGTKRALTRLWSGLKDLEEVSLEYCQGLGNVAFVGDNAEDPVFLKLEKLKKLSLKGVDHMPKITDTLFTRVFRNLNLTHFTMTSDAPLKSVIFFYWKNDIITAAGIRSLLEGNFAKSIERFSFQDWSLEDVSAEEFQELGKQFRAFDML